MIVSQGASLEKAVTKMATGWLKNGKIAHIYIG